MNDIYKDVTESYKELLIAMYVNSGLWELKQYDKIDNLLEKLENKKIYLVEKCENEN